MDLKRTPVTAKDSFCNFTTRQQMGQQQTDQLFEDSYKATSNDLSVTSEDVLDILLQHIKELCKSKTGF